MYEFIISNQIILASVTEIILDPQDKSWWLSIIRTCFWTLLRGVLFILDILYDVLMYIVKLDFLSSGPLGEFYNKYKVLLHVFLVIAFMILGISIILSDSGPMQKSKLSNSLTAIGLVVLFATIFPLLNDFSMSLTGFMNQDNDISMSVKLVQSTTKKLEYSDGDVIEKDITVDEAIELISGNSSLNDKESTWLEKSIYQYDIAWVQLIATSGTLIFGCYLLGLNAIRCVIDIGYVRVLSIIALPVSVVNEGVKKKFALETFKVFLTLPLSVQALSFYMMASNWLMNVDIFASDALTKYSNTWAAGLVTSIFYLIAIPALSLICLDGSSRIVNMLGIDTGVKSATGALTTMHGIGMGAKTVAATVGKSGRGAARAATSFTGFTKGFKDGLTPPNNDQPPKDGPPKPKGGGTKEGGDTKNSPEKHASSNANENTGMKMPQNRKIGKIQRVSNRFANSQYTGYQAAEFSKKISEKMSQRSRERMV